MTDTPDGNNEKLIKIINAIEENPSAIKTILNGAKLEFSSETFEKNKLDLLRSYRDSAVEIDAKERSGKINVDDRIQLILSLRKLVEINVTPPVTIFDLMYKIERCQMQPSQAFSLIDKLLTESTFDVSGAYSVLKEADSKSQNNPDSVAGKAIKLVQDGILADGDAVISGLKSIGESVATAGTSIKSSSNKFIDSVTSKASDKAKGVSTQISSFYKNRQANLEIKNENKKKSVNKDTDPEFKEDLNHAVSHVVQSKILTSFRAESDDDGGSFFDFDFD